MKLSVLLVVAVAVVLGSGFPTSANYNLRNELLDFVNLLPKQKMLSIAMDHFMNDKDVQEAVNFIMSNEFEKIILDLENVQEIQAILRYYQTQGIDVYHLIHKFHKFMGMNPYIPPPNYLRLRKRSTLSLIDELTSILPKEKIEELKEQKLDTSIEYTSFYHISTSAVYNNLYCQAIDNSEVQQIIHQAESHGLHLLKIYDFVRSVFGIENVKLIILRNNCNT